MQSYPDTIWLVAGVLMLGPILLLAAAGGIFLWARSWRARAGKAVNLARVQVEGAQVLLLQLGELRD